MIRSLKTAASGMYAQQLYVDTIANNLANVNTTAYKKTKLEFQDLLYHTIKASGVVKSNGVADPTSLQIGYGVRPIASQKIFIQGEMVQTDNQLDLAIQGRGFFRLLDENGEEIYTRDGSFKLSGDGSMVTSHGYKMEPEIIIPSDAVTVTVNKNGVISVTVEGDNMPLQIGKIELTNFINPAGLENLGENLYRETAASGEPLINFSSNLHIGVLHQGFLETSNVNVVEEMVNLIVAQRAYEINSKAVRAAEEMLTTVTNLKR